MKICENCGKEHNGNYGSGRFCCNKCAKSYSTKCIKYRYKQTACIKCGKEYMIPLNANKTTYICDECKNIRKKLITTDNVRNKSKIEHYIKIKNKYIKCKVCGREYLKGEKCENFFCQKHSIQQFSSLIKYFGFNPNKLGTIEVEDEFYRIRNILYNLYWVEHKSSSEICKIFNYPNVSNLLDKPFKYLGIKHKTLSEAVVESYLMNRINPPSTNCYNDSWHISWDGKEVYLRSSYEKDYAIELDNKKIKYEVEAKRIKYYDTIMRKFRCAVPDFYLPDTNEIVEIKSAYTLGGNEGIINLKDKFNEYTKLGYKCKLIIEHKEMNLYELPENPIYDIVTKEIISDSEYNHSGKSGWKLMNKDGISRKVKKENILDYLGSGWQLGITK